MHITKDIIFRLSVPASNKLHGYIPSYFEQRHALHHENEKDRQGQSGNVAEEFKHITSTNNNTETNVKSILYDDAEKKGNSVHQNARKHSRRKERKATTIRVNKENKEVLPSANSKSVESIWRRSGHVVTLSDKAQDKNFNTIGSTNSIPAEVASNSKTKMPPPAKPIGILAVITIVIIVVAGIVLYINAEVDGEVEVSDTSSKDESSKNERTFIEQDLLFMAKITERQDE